MNKNVNEARLTLNVSEVACLLGLSRASAYEAVRMGQIPSIRIGRRIIIPRVALMKMQEEAGKDEAKSDY